MLCFQWCLCDQGICSSATPLRPSAHLVLVTPAFMWCKPQWRYVPLQSVVIYFYLHAPLKVTYSISSFMLRQLMLEAAACPNPAEHILEVFSAQMWWDW